MRAELSRAGAAILGGDRWFTDKPAVSIGEPLVSAESILIGRSRADPTMEAP